MTIDDRMLAEIVRRVLSVMAGAWKVRVCAGC